MNDRDDNPFAAITALIDEQDHHHSEGSERRAQGWSTTFRHWYEAAEADRPGVFAYTDKISYQPGEEVEVKISSSCSSANLRLYRDGSVATVLYAGEINGLGVQESRNSPYRNGCGWETSWTWTLPDDTRSGAYILRLEIPGSWRPIVHHHIFIVRAKTTEPQSKLLLLAATSTWCAYNDWGGANSYEGIAGPDNDAFSPVLSYQRPWSSGMAWLPEGAPRFSHDQPPRRGETPRYPSFEYGYANGFAKYFAAAGWAQFERHFAVWAENNGYEHDVACQVDIETHPDLIRGYDAVVIVGHDEYWSTPMRDVVDGYVENGGRIARFAGNFLWQVRLEDNGRTQVCYKGLAHTEDPAFKETPHLLTSAWADPFVNRSGAETFGLDGTEGGYCRVGGAVPRWPGGWVVQEPTHWSLEGTDLQYGDMFGQEARTFSYEVDGVPHTFENGKIVPTSDSGAPEGMVLIASGPASMIEPVRDIEGAVWFLAYADGAAKAVLRYGTTDAEAMERANYTRGFMAAFAKGAGEVFNAGSCEWVQGLRLRDSDTETITRNVLDRFLKIDDADPSREAS